MRNESCRFRRPAALCAAGIGLLFLLASLHGFEWNYLPDYPGKAAASIDYSLSAVYKLSAAEKASVLADITRLSDRLLAQPSFNPPRGIEVRGFIGSFGGSARSLNPAAGLLKEPVQAFGTLYYCFYYRDEMGKPRYNPHSTWELQVTVNDPVHNGPNPALGGPDFEHILAEPRKVGELQGFPVYRNLDGSEFIVLCRTGRPYWLPITREEYVNHWIKLIEADIAQFGSIPDYMERLKRHKAAIASMSAAERQAQARHAVNTDRSEPELAPMTAYDPPLSPMGSKQGHLLIKANPEWYNPSLPRTAFQLIAVRFMYRGDVDPDKPEPTDTGLITALRLWETLHTSDWKAISSVLAH